MPKNKWSWWGVGAFALSSFLVFDFLKKSTGFTSVVDQLGVRDNQVLADPVDGDNLKLKNITLPVSELARIVADNGIALTTVNFVVFEDDDNKGALIEELAAKLRKLQFSVKVTEIARLDLGLPATLDNLNLIQDFVDQKQGVLQLFVILDFVFAVGIRNNADILIKLGVNNPQATVKTLLSRVQGLSEVQVITFPSTSKETLRQTIDELTSDSFNFLVTQITRNEDTQPLNLNLLRG